MIISLFIVLIFTLSFSAPAFVANEINGKCGDNVKLLITNSSSDIGIKKVGWDAFVTNCGF